MTTLQRKLLTLAAAVAVVAGIAWFVPEPRGLLLDAALWAESAPGRAWPLYIVCFVIAVVVMFPGWVFMVAGGYLFGPLMGVVLSIIGNLVGSVAAFYLAKSLARDWIKNRLDHSSRFQGFDQAVSRRGLQTVMFARLALLPNNLINYACGVTGMRPLDFVLGTAIGILPILIANVLIGASAMDLFVAIEDGTFDRQRPPVTIFVAIFAMAALIVVLAKRFGPKLADPPADSEPGEEPVRPD